MGIRATQACSRALHFSLFCSPPRFAAGQRASQTRPTVRSADPHFHTQLLIFTLSLPELTPEPSILTLELDPEPPIFHIPTNIWGEYPPPPPPPPKINSCRMFPTSLINIYIPANYSISFNFYVFNFFYEFLMYSVFFKYY